MVRSQGVRRGRGALGASALACAAALAACTPSIAPGTQVGADPFATPVVPTGGDAQSGSGQGVPQSGGLDAPTPRQGHGNIVVAHPAGRELPAALVDGFTSATGFTVSQVSVPTAQWEKGNLGGNAADVLVDLDETELLAATASGTVGATAPEDASTPAGTGIDGAAAGIAYGRDDVCVLADTQWYAANRRSDPPTTLADLTRADVASLLTVPDPATTVEGRAFVQLIGASTGKSAAATMTSLLRAGAATVDEGGASAAWTATASAGSPSGATAASGARPLLVARASTIAASETNTGTEAAGRALGATCLKRDVFAAIDADATHRDGAESLVAYLLGRSAQGALAAAGTVHPLDAGAAAGTAAQWFLTPAKDAVSLPVADVAKTTDWLAAWRAATTTR